MTVLPWQRGRFMNCFEIKLASRKLCPRLERTCSARTEDAAHGRLAFTNITRWRPGGRDVKTFRAVRLLEVSFLFLCSLHLSSIFHFLAALSKRSSWSPPMQQMQQSGRLFICLISLHFILFPPSFPPFSSRPHLFRRHAIVSHETFLMEQVSFGVRRTSLTSVPPILALTNGDSEPRAFLEEEG